MSHQSRVDNGAQIWSLINNASDAVVISQWCHLSRCKAMLFADDVEDWLLDMKQNIFNSFHVAVHHK